MALAKQLSPSFQNFIRSQPMFFVATAAPEGRVNLSPKGLDTLHIAGPDRIIWLNLTGSGNETAAHLLESPRMTLMFCAFEGDARILRVYGSARVAHPRDDDWENLSALFPSYAGSRQIFDLSIEMAQISCGSGVPEMKMLRPRGDAELVPYYAEMGENGLRDYWRRKNMLSIDGKPTGL